MISALGYLVAGLGIGLCYFAGLWRCVGRLGSGGGLASIVAMRLAGFMLLGGFLALVVHLEGGAALLAGAAGVLLARACVARSVAGLGA